MFVFSEKFTEYAMVLVISLYLRYSGCVWWAYKNSNATLKWFCPQFSLAAVR